MPNFDLPKPVIIANSFRGDLPDVRARRESKAVREGIDTDLKHGVDSLQSVVDRAQQNEVETQAREERNALVLQQQQLEKQKNFDAMMFATSPEVFLECIDSINLAKLDEVHAKRYEEKLKQFVPDQQDFPYTDEQYDILRAVFGNGRGGTDVMVPEMYSQTVQAIYDRAFRIMNARYRPASPTLPPHLRRAKSPDVSSASAK